MFWGFFKRCVSLKRCCHFRPCLTEFNGLVLSCFTLSRLTLFKDKKKKSEKRLTAIVLKQDPNSQTVKENASFNETKQQCFVFGKNLFGCYF